MATSTRDLERVEVMGRVAQEGLKLVDAAAMLRLSYRQVKRIWRRYHLVGRQGMKHAHAGRPSNRGKPDEATPSSAELSQAKIFRFGGRAIRPDVSRRALGCHDTLRRWMLAEHLWSRRKGKKHCQRREREEHFGELVQLDRLKSK